eukprot:scaffold26521_cov69-Phaeocystis_antarctica.AAC.2
MKYALNRIGLRPAVQLWERKKKSKKCLGWRALRPPRVVQKSSRATRGSRAMCLAPRALSPPAYLKVLPGGVT